MLGVTQTWVLRSTCMPSLGVYHITRDNRHNLLVLRVSVSPLCVMDSIVVEETEPPRSSVHSHSQTKESWMKSIDIKNRCAVPSSVYNSQLLSNIKYQDIQIFIFSMTKCDNGAGALPNQCQKISTSVLQSALTNCITLSSSDQVLLHRSLFLKEKSFSEARCFAVLSFLFTALLPTYYFPAALLLSRAVITIPNSPPHRCNDQPLFQPFASQKTRQDETSQ